MSHRSVPAGTLRAFTRDLLGGVGTPDEQARQVARSLVGSDLRGHTSHGVLRVPWYVEMAEAGQLDPGATPTVEAADGATASIDGRRAFGQVVGRTVVREATERAAAHGVAAVGVRDATHLGRVGEWAARAADAEVCLLAFVNTQGGARTVAPPGSADRLLSTNPVAVGLPTFDALDFPVVLDAATSQVAHGKIRERAATGEPIPEGWTVGADGAPVRDAEAFLDGEGAIRPLGGGVSGYKGFGLSVVTELLAAFVGTGQVAGGGDDWANNAAAFLAVDPLRFLAREAAADRVGTLADHLRSADPDPDVAVGAGASGSGPLLPGEAEHRAAERHRETGVPVPDRVLADLRSLAEEHGATVPDDL